MSATGSRKLCSILAIILGLLLAGPLSAALIFVDEDSDVVSNDNNCSLREAVIAANTNTAVDDCTAGQSSGSDGIFVLIGQTAQSITLSAPLVITDSVSITGSGVDNLVLLPSGSGYPAFRVDVANAGEDFSLASLRIGGFSESAVEIVNADSVTVQRVSFANNSHDDCGGAINGLYFPAGPTRSLTELLVSDSEFSFNTSSDYGGAICIGLEDDVEDAVGADLTIERSTFLLNSASFGGGAVSARKSESALLTVVESTFEGNETGNTDGLEHGGAIATEFGFTTIISSSFDDNSSILGQSVATGLQSGSAALVQTRITNSTFVGQANADVFAEIFQSAGELRLQHNTFSLDGNGAVFASDSVTARLRANLFVGDVPACQGGGTLISSGFNVEDFISCAFDADDEPFTAVEMLPLADYGGPTLTMPPNPNSAAVDLVVGDCFDATANSIVGADQRGEPRPRDGDASGGLGQCDAGAFEWPNANLLAISFPNDGLGQVQILGDFPLTCDAPDACQLPLPENETYTLIANPAPGSEFTGWGGSCSGHGSCQVTLDILRFVAASFELLDDPLFSDRFEN